MRHDVGPKGIWGLNIENKFERMRRIQLGLQLLGPHFQACICDGCQGSGYSDYYECVWCKSVGITQHGTPAPASILNQVLVASDIATEILK